MKKTSTFKTLENTTHEYETKVNGEVVEVEIEHDHENDTFEFTVYGGYDYGDGETYYSLSDCKREVVKFVKEL